MYIADQWGEANMPTAVQKKKTRKALLDDLQVAVVAYLKQQHGKTSPGADAVREIAREQGVDHSYVTAAMWALVDEGTLDYGRGAELTLTSKRS
jgi:DNA-binding MarR family transcriptional regulator